MSSQNANLTAAEWDVMECLWERAPLSGREVTEKMHAKCGWSRSTTLTLLSRLEAKGAVLGDAEKGKKAFRPLISREDAALQETEDFLGRVYKGSVRLMVSAMTQKQSLSQKEIDELYALLKGLEVDKDA
ncbi:MAG: BlaI/MecI/CopY family transcriptional regulator [Oscillospiraceae bacterium]|nr:BlaI/MecI/CopY family transcriptional regulator [Oscillospiraceae bacterium]